MSFLIRALFTTAALAATGCVTGSMVTLAAGPKFDGTGLGASVSLEYSFLLHEPPPVPPATPELDVEREHGSGNLLGLGLTAAVQLGWLGVLYGTFAGGIDYLPFMGEWGNVTFGVLGGYGLSERANGAALVGPRLGITITPWQWIGARLGIGGRVDCAFIFGETEEDRTWACGPSLTGALVVLGER